MDCKYCGALVPEWESCVECGPKLVSLRAELSGFKTLATELTRELEQVKEALINSQAQSMRRGCKLYELTGSTD